MAADRCPVHRIELSYADCWNGCDEGYFDEYEDDPINSDPGDMAPCEVCGATGRLAFCPRCQDEREAQPPTRPLTSMEIEEAHGIANVPSQDTKICRESKGERQ